MSNRNVMNTGGVSPAQVSDKKRIKSIVAILLIGIFTSLNPNRTDGLFVNASAAGREWFVSPGGAASGNGSADDPIDLPTALSSSSPAQPGDVIWLRGGTYGGTFTSHLTGTATAPIIVRQYPSERAILDGHGSGSHTLIVRGAYTWYWGFEVMNSDPTRVYTRRVDVDDPASPDRVRGTGLVIYGPRTKFVNLIVHDAMNGFFFAESAVDAEIYGALIYNNGVIDTARGHGHGIYIQNRIGTKRITDVISFGNHASGMKAYAEAGFIEGVHFEGVISFANGVARLSGTPLDKVENLFVGSTDNPADRISVVSSAFYHAPHVLASNVTLGYQNTGNGSLTVRDNMVMGGSVALTTKHWRTLSLSGNTMFAIESTNSNSDQSLAQVRQPASTTYSWDRNTYFDGTAKIFPFDFNDAVNQWGGGNLSITDWQRATLFDANSTYHRGRPTGLVVRLRPNRYERGRAHLAIYNWAGHAAVSVDIAASGLTIGDRYEIRDALNYFADAVAGGTYDGRPVTLPLTASSVSAPVGGVLFRPEHPAPEFSAFVILKKPTPAGLRASATIPAPASAPAPAPAPIPAAPRPAPAPVPWSTPPPASTPTPSRPVPTPTSTPTRPSYTSIKLLAPGELVAGVVMLKATVYSTTRISGVQFFVDGVTVGVLNASAPYEVAWNTIPFKNGVHQVIAVAVQGGTTLAHSSAALVRVNNIQPR